MRSSRLLLSLLSLFVVAELAAQPVLTQEDFLSVGDQAMEESYFGAVDVTGFTDPGPTGHWDFTREFGVPSGVRIECLAVEEGPVDAAEAFPGADRVVKRSILPPPGVPPEDFPEFSEWWYYSCNPDGRTSYGLAVTDGFGPPFTAIQSPPSVDFPLPLTLGDEWTQEYQVSDPFISDNIRASSTVDAWGTAILPGIGEVECVRVNTEIVNRLTDMTVSPPVEFPHYMRSYRWVAVGIGVVATITTALEPLDTFPASGFTTASNLSMLVEYTPAAPVAPQFVRGEINGDGTYNLADAIGIVRHLVGRKSLDCEAAADLNDDGQLDIQDVLYSLRYVFNRGPAPAAPFPACGPDPTEDLTCEMESCS